MVSYLTHLTPFLPLCVCVSHVEMLFLELGGMCDTKMLLGTTARERPENLKNIGLEVTVFSIGNTCFKTEAGRSPTIVGLVKILMKAYL